VRTLSVSQSSLILSTSSLSTGVCQSTWFELEARAVYAKNGVAHTHTSRRDLESSATVFQTILSIHSQER
jgi:hypothetical protein